MLQRLASASHRITVLLCAAFALFGVGVALQLSSASSANDAASGQLAAAERSNTAAASRGSVRTPLLQQTSTTGEETTTVVPNTTEVPTTEAPTTTAAPTTTSPPATVKPKPAVAAAAQSGNSQTGGASYYLYKPGGCAHKTLPKGTVVTVTNLSNGKSTTCVVNDRGPYVAGRIIDLDTRVFQQVASTSSGVFNARISW